MNPITAKELRDYVYRKSTTPGTSGVDKMILRAAARIEELEDRVEELEVSQLEVLEQMDTDS